SRAPCGFRPLMGVVGPSPLTPHNKSGGSPRKATRRLYPRHTRRRVGTNLSADDDLRARLHHAVESLEVVVVHAHAPMAHGFADRRLIVQMRAVNEIAVARVELVGAECVRHAS